jgi:hypothetical protein
MTESVDVTGQQEIERLDLVDVLLSPVKIFGSEQEFVESQKKSGAPSWQRFG